MPRRRPKADAPRDATGSMLSLQRHLRCKESLCITAAMQP
jgi:hypothetical protein